MLVLCVTHLRSASHLFDCSRISSKKPVFLLCLPSVQLLPGESVIIGAGAHSSITKDKIDITVTQEEGSSFTYCIHGPFNGEKEGLS